MRNLADAVLSAVAGRRAGDRAQSRFSFTFRTTRRGETASFAASSGHAFGREERSMTNPNGPDADKESSSDVRLMWISVAVIILIIVGGMGINMMIHRDSNATTVETTATSPKGE